MPLLFKIRLRERTHLASTWFLSRVFCRSLVHFIGDSHVFSYCKGRFFRAHHIGPATAYKLASEFSTTNSRHKLLVELRKVNKKRDIVVLVFGEIDCRMHINKQFIISGGKISLKELIEETINKYGIALKEVSQSGYSFLVYGILPAATQGNIYENPYYADKPVRLIINREFNKQLKDFCNRNGYRFLDVQAIFADESGFISEHFSNDGLHLNKMATPILEKMLSIKVGALKGQSNSEFRIVAE